MKKFSLVKMKRSNTIIAELLAAAGSQVKPGVTTAELDRWAESFICERGGKPAFKGLYGFPSTLCVSVNDEVIHGIPSETRVLREGDIVSIDVGALVEGHYADAARTFPVGEVSAEDARLIKVTKQAFERALEVCVPGNRIGDIGYAVQSHVESCGYNVIRDYVGHGIGRELHMAPEIPNFGKKGTGPVIKEGMCLAIEPMVVTGNWDVEVLDDFWTVKTADGGNASHHENTVYVGEGGVIVLTDHSYEGNYVKE